LDIEKLVSSDANPVIIRNNVIEDHDRGIRIRGEHTAVVEQNQFVAGGAGIEILAKSGVDIIKNSFRVNGDAIRIHFTSGFHPVSIIENTIENCSTGISADASGSISIRNNSLTNNQRGMYLELGNNGSGEVNVLNNTITGSSLGGGLTVGPGTNSSGFQCSIIGNKIVGNINEWGGTGGGIKCWTGNVGTITISENEIEGNTAQNGGGLQLDGSITVKNNQIKNNQSLFNGAGLSVGNFYSGQVVIQDNLFEGNSAGYNGGAIYSAATPDISGNQFISNYAAPKKEVPSTVKPPTGMPRKQSPCRVCPGWYHATYLVLMKAAIPTPETRMACWEVNGARARTTGVRMPDLMYTAIKKTIT
jgi:predicted outer membrane repeat protein